MIGAGGLRGAGRGRGAVPQRQVDAGAGAARRARWPRRARRWSSSAPRRLRDRIRALTNVQANQGDQPGGRRGGGRGGAAPGGRPRLRAGVLHPRAPELGQPRLFPAHRGGGGAGRDPRGVPRPVLRQQDPAAADPDQPRAGQRRPAGRGADARSSGARWRSGRAAARREGGAGRAGGAQRPRGARRGGWPRAPARRRCSRGWRRPSGSTAPPERIEVYDNSHIMGTNAVGGDDRRGAGGVPEVAVPQVQHPHAGAHPGRRLRHDARGADPALRAAGQARTPTGSRTPGRTWC